MIDEETGTKSPIVTGVDHLPKKCVDKCEIYSVACEIKKDTVRIKKNLITLPAYMIGMFAISIAVLSKPQRIYLAGFDGYDSSGSSLHKDMMFYFDQLNKSGSNIISITPTTYTIPIHSVYQLIS